MLFVTIQDLEIFQSCPKKLFLQRNSQTVLAKKTSSWKIIDRIYTELSKSKPPTWRTIGRWCEKEFANTASSTCELAAALEKSWIFRKQLLSWYNQNIKLDCRTWHNNLYLTAPITETISIKDNIGYLAVDQERRRAADARGLGCPHVGCDLRVKLARYQAGAKGGHVEA